MSTLTQTLTTTTVTRGLQTLSNARSRPSESSNEHGTSNDGRVVVSRSVPGACPTTSSQPRDSASQGTNSTIRTQLKHQIGGPRFGKSVRYIKIIGTLLLGILGVTATWWGLQLAMWTAVKEFREDCREIKAATGNVSPDCAQALSQSLEAPPVFNWKMFLHVPSVQENKFTKRRVHPKFFMTKIRDWTKSEIEVFYGGMENLWPSSKYAKIRDDTRFQRDERRSGNWSPHVNRDTDGIQKQGDSIPIMYIKGHQPTPLEEYVRDHLDEGSTRSRTYMEYVYRKDRSQSSSIATPVRTESHDEL